VVKGGLLTALELTRGLTPIEYVIKLAQSIRDSSQECHDGTHRLLP
jgi:hypothetical protein